MTTEEEARGKYCHVTFGSNAVGKCLGSECMAWRWTDEWKTTGKQWSCPHCGGKGEVGGVTCGECEGQGRGWKSARAGYCGLAGQPAP